MELTILHLYPQLMSLYGEYANLAILRRHLERLGVRVTLKAAAAGEEPDFTAGLIYMGAGTERSQKAALAALLPHAGALRSAVGRGAAVLFTGNAMEVLGASVTDAGGEVWEALGLASFTTVETDRRTPHDVIAHTGLWEAPVVGFMNKCSRTAGVETPLFDRLSLGFGNEAEGGAEGYTAGNVFATHITGPILAKNPQFTALLLRRLFESRGWSLPDPLPREELEERVYAGTLAELSRRAERQRGGSPL